MFSNLVIRSQSFSEPVPPDSELYQCFSVVVVVFFFPLPLSSTGLLE